MILLLMKPTSALWRDTITISVHSLFFPSFEECFLFLLNIFTYCCGCLAFLFLWCLLGPALYSCTIAYEELTVKSRASCSSRAGAVDTQSSPSMLCVALFSPLRLLALEIKNQRRDEVVHPEYWNSWNFYNSCVCSCECSSMRKWERRVEIFKSYRPSERSGWCVSFSFPRNCLWLMPELVQPSGR